MRTRLFTTVSLAALIIGGAAPAVSAQIDWEPDDELLLVEPVGEVMIVTPTTLPQPTLPKPGPIIDIDPDVLVIPTIPEEPPVPPDDDDDELKPGWIPDLDLCPILKNVCPPQLDDPLKPGGGADPGDPGDPGDEPTDPGDPGDPGDEPTDPGDSDDPGEEPTDPDDPGDPGEEPTDPGDQPTDDTPETGDGVDIDAPRPGTPNFTG